jgi:hypothetical protein
MALSEKGAGSRHSYSRLAFAHLSAAQSRVVSRGSFFSGCLLAAPPEADGGFVLPVAVQILGLFDRGDLHGLDGGADTSAGRFSALEPLGVPVTRLLEMRIGKYLFAINIIKDGHPGSASLPFIYSETLDRVLLGSIQPTIPRCVPKDLFALQKYYAVCHIAP